MGYKVAIVGATGNVGREMLNILEEVSFPVDELHAIASRKSKGVEVSFGDRTVKCQDIEQFDFSKVDIVLMSAGGAVSREWSEKIGKAGPIVIDGHVNAPGHYAARGLGTGTWGVTAFEDDRATSSAWRSRC